MKNYMVTHTLKSDEAMDTYYKALETKLTDPSNGNLADRGFSLQAILLIHSDK